MRARPERWLGSLAFWLMVAPAFLAGLASGYPVAAGATEPDTDVVRIHLLWTNDVHGHIAPEGATFMNPDFPPPLGGAASAAAYIKGVRAEAAKAGESVLLIDVGDIFQGTPVGNKTEGRAVIDYFNEIGYDFLVPGNHDFDLGREKTEALARRSHFPWVCANLVEASTGEVVDWCTPTVMLERGGIQIGVIGLITPDTERMAFPANIAGLKFLPMAETVRRYEKKLRAAGAQIILLGVHAGLPYDAKEGWKQITESQEEEGRQSQDTYGGYARSGAMNLMELANAVAGIDVAVGGHTHRGYAEPWIDPVHHTLCFETFGNGSSLGHAILKIDRQTGTLIGYEAPSDGSTLVTLFEDELWPDTTVQERISPAVEAAEAEMDKVVGRTTAALGRGDAGSNLVGKLVTDAMREYFDADFSFQNLGGLRADLPAGDITARDIFGVLPFGNELLIVNMPGEILRRVVETKLAGHGDGICISGGEVVYDLNRPSYDRVLSFTLGGEPLQDDRMYRVVVTNYLMEGNSGLDFLTTIPEKDVELTQITTAEAVEHYLRLHDPYKPAVDDRWREQPGGQQAAYLTDLRTE
jgi:5'-nucleotidase/UDP-sugar diphosphatase